MAVTESYVQVAVDGSGKKVENVRVLTSQGQVERQVTATADPEDPDARRKVSAALPGPTAYGAATRECAPGYDSGLAAVPDTLTAITTDTIRAGYLLVCNRTAAVAWISLTNTAGGEYLLQYPLQARMSQAIPLGRVTMVGAKWQANAVNAVNAQLVGEK